MKTKGRRMSKNITDIRRSPEQVLKDKIEATNSMYLDPLPTKKNPTYYDDPSKGRKKSLPNYTDLPLNSKTK